VKATPGSASWLLGHELRLAWYGAAVNAGGKRRPGTVAMIAWVSGWIVLHLFAYSLLQRLGPDDAQDSAHEPLLGMLAGAVLLVCATFMLSNALKASVLALFERGDLDLLLSSPLPSRSIFAVRLLGVAASSAALFLYLLAPFAHVAVALGRPRWLAIYPAVAATALVSACAAMLLTLALVRLLGARRTRTIAQVMAALAGALLFLLSQAYNFVSHGSEGAATEQAARTLAQHSLFGPASPLWLPGRAALGEALPLAGMLLLALAAFFLTLARTHRFFVHGLQQAAGVGRAAARPAGRVRFRFRSSLFDTIVVKEWRLIARDPHLISQVLLQLVYLLPLLFLVLRGSDTPAPAIGAGLTLLCSSLTGGLAWIVISAEDAPDLLRSAPAAMRTIRLAKLAAATMPPLLLVALPLLWLIVRAPLAGLLVCFTATGAVLGAALVVLWVGRPAPRSDFKARGKENFLCSAFELLTSLSWGGLAWALGSLATAPLDWSAPAAALALGTGLATLLLARVLRRRSSPVRP
jgi:ABC-2 type transport system permease protein